MEKNKYLRFTGYRIEKIDYSVNENFDFNKNSELIPSFAFRYVFSNEFEDKCNIIIGIKYDKKANHPFLLNLIIRGFFEINEKDFLINGFAILFPYVRTIITDITKASLIPLVIPTMNIQNFIENKLEELELDKSEYRE